MNRQILWERFQDCKINLGFNNLRAVFREYVDQLIEMLPAEPVPLNVIIHVISRGRFQFLEKPIPTTLTWADWCQKLSQELPQSTYSLWQDILTYLFFQVASDATLVQFLTANNINIVINNDDQ